LNKHRSKLVRKKFTQVVHVIGSIVNPGGVKKQYAKLLNKKFPKVVHVIRGIVNPGKLNKFCQFRL
jgi:hypothetical protein